MFTTSLEGLYVYSWTQVQVLQRHQQPSSLDRKWQILIDMVNAEITVIKVSF